MFAGPEKPILICQSGEDAKRLRKLLGMNQRTFWLPIGITQSGGSRYESGRDMPDPITNLLHLVYGTEQQAFELLEWLRAKPWGSSAPSENEGMRRILR